MQFTWIHHGFSALPPFLVEAMLPGHIEAVSSSDVVFVRRVGFSSGGGTLHGGCGGCVTKIIQSGKKRLTVERKLETKMGFI